MDLNFNNSNERKGERMKEKITQIKNKKTELTEKISKLKTAILVMVSGLCYQVPVHASGDVTQKIGEIESLVISIIAAVGVIVLAWGIFEFAAAYQQNDSSAQTHSLKKIVSGIIMCCVSGLVTLLQ